VSDYWLDDWAGGKDFSSSLRVQTGSEAHPAPCTMGTAGPFPGPKRGRGMTLTTHLHLMPRSKNEYELYYSPSKRRYGV
jgi:hypothetical protein